MLLIPSRPLAALALAALPWSGLSCARSASGAGRPAASPAAWSDRGPVPGVPPQRVLRHPTLAVLGDDLVYAGNALFPDSGTHRAIFEVRTVAGRSLGRPPGDFHFGDARALVHEPSGTLHLVWGESDSSATRPDGWPLRYTALWHAAYAGGAWREPTRVLRGYSIAWASQSASAAVDRAGCVHVAVPLLHDERAGLHHARGFCAPWRDTVLARGITYAAVATTDDAAVLVALAGRDSTAPLDRNVVRVLRSTDGSTWAQVGRVQVGAPEDRVQQVWLGSRDGRLHVAWVHVLAAGGSMLDEAGRVVDRVGSRLVHVTSRDGGTTWADTVMSAVVAHPIFSARFLAHRCGVLAAYEAVSAAGAEVSTTVRTVDLQQGGASPLPVFPGSLMSFEPAPAARRDTLLLFAGVLKAGGGTPVAHLASRPACHDAVIH